ncbi:unnamed protein product [Parnassius apollo]|uniref:(apollo) hypothetical protein n=1 Tax=Parnassius apollo TaxID=110799 RepID=A0A8S3XU24_PARAO|nr:unnamed protein product [Parnassius apollo]
MALSRCSCRICLSENEFNVSLFGSFCRRTNMLDKILVCLKLVIEESDYLNTICYNCVNKIENYYDFITFVKKCQTKLGNREMYERQRNINTNATSNVREQVYDTDSTFSFLVMSNTEDKEDVKSSSPFFSYFSPPNVLIKQSNEPSSWKTPRSLDDSLNIKIKREDNCKKKNCKNFRTGRSSHHSRDLFESQDTEEQEVSRPNSLDWKLPDNNIIKRVREKCFGRSDF